MVHNDSPPCGVNWVQLTSQKEMKNMARAYKKKASDYDFEDYLNDELRNTSLTRQDEMKFRNGLTAHEAIDMARKYDIITKEEAMEYRRELKGSKGDYEEKENLRHLSDLWKHVENVAGHARAQIDARIQSNSELKHNIKDIREYLKKIERIID